MNHGSPSATFNGLLSYLIMLSIGVGMLSLPGEMRHAGTLSAVTLTVFAAAAMWWSMLALLRAKAACEARGSPVMRTYQDFSEELLGGRFGRRFVEVIIIGLQFGVIAVYFSFMTSTLVALFPNIFSMSERGSAWAWSALLYPVLCLTCCVRYLRDLSSIASVAMVFFGLGWLVLIAVCFQRLDNDPPRNQRLRPKDGQWWAAMSFFAAICYSFEGLPNVIIQISNTLDTPKRMPELVTTSLTIVSCAYLFTCVVGSLAFAKPDDPLSLSLISEYGNRGYVAVTVNVLLAFAVLLKFPLQFYPMICLIERNLDWGPGASLNMSKEKQEEAALLLPDNAEADSVLITEADGGVLNVGFRCGIVACAALTALAVNSNTDLINLTGIFFGPSVSFIFPCVAEIICVSRGAYTRTRLQLAVNVVIVAVMSVSCVVGSVQVLIKIA